MTADDALDGVSFTNLDEPLFADAGATKRDLVEYLDAMADRILPELRDRPLSVIRVVRGQTPRAQRKGSHQTDRICCAISAASNFPDFVVAVL